MAGETPITVIGNLTADPELRFTPSGAAVANFTVASTPRTFDRQTNEWKDGEALFLNCSVWRQAAENAAESLVRGMRVIVSGNLKARSYETREGEKRTVFEIDVAGGRPEPEVRHRQGQQDDAGPAAAAAGAAATAAATTRGRPAVSRAAQSGGQQGGRIRWRQLGWPAGWTAVRPAGRPLGVQRPAGGSDEPPF